MSEPFPDAGAARPRHPEKAKRPDRPSGRKPPWIRVKAPGSAAFAETRKILRGHGLYTVCEEAACPNIGECWAQRHATMMIMGPVCTRACAFCNVATGKPGALDPTSMVASGAASRIAAMTAAKCPAPPSARSSRSTPDVFNHNLETVPRLYPEIRPGARYYASLRLLDRVKELDPSMFTKSGLMVGLGESRIEVHQVMDDLRAADVDFLTIGQYLQPTPKHAPIADFVTPEDFEDYARTARGRGFLLVSATPLTRSSYHADRDFAALRAARAAAMARL